MSGMSDSVRLPSISAVFPALNDAGTISGMILGVRAVLPRVTSEWEIIVVDDGSTDNTAVVLAALAGTVPELRVIRHSRNQGYGAAVRAGFDAAGMEWIFYTDGDGQYDPAELALLAGAVRGGVDVVNGYKIERHDPWYRILLGRSYHSLVRLFFRFQLKDVDCDFRLFRRRLLKPARLRSRTGTLGLEFAVRLQQNGAVFAEVPVHHYSRRSGRSQFFSWPRLWATAGQLLQLWVECAGWKIPGRRR